MSIDDATPEDWNNLTRHPLDRRPAKIEHKLSDAVNNPAHYNKGDIECIDAIKAMLSVDEYIGYLRCNSLKYRWRFRYKNKPIEDLRKATWYDKKLLDFLMENQDVLGS